MDELLKMAPEDFVIEYEKMVDSLKRLKKDMNKKVVEFVKQSPLQCGDVVTDSRGEEVMIAAVGVNLMKEASVSVAKVFRKKKDGTFSKRAEIAFGVVTKDGVAYNCGFRTVLYMDSDGKVNVALPECQGLYLYSF